MIFFIPPPLASRPAGHPPAAARRTAGRRCRVPAPRSGPPWPGRSTPTASRPARPRATPAPHRPDPSRSTPSRAALMPSLLAALGALRGLLCGTLSRAQLRLPALDDLHAPLVVVQAQPVLHVLDRPGLYRNAKLLHLAAQYPDRLGLRLLADVQRHGLHHEQECRADQPRQRNLAR